MNTRPFTLSLALWACSHAALAQPSDPAPAAPATPPGALVQPAAPQPSGTTASDGKLREDTSSEPRILRGDDKLVAPAKTLAPLGGPPISLNFEEAPIAEVVRTILGDLLRVDYVLYQPINGAVTLSTRAPVSPDQAVFLLESALYANGLALVRDARGSYHVGRPEALKGVAGGVRQAVNGQPLQPGSGAIVVPLQYIGAPEMAAILRPMMPAESLVRVDSLRNLLVLTGTRAQAEGWLELVSTFDVNLLRGMSVGVFPLKYVTAQEVEAALHMLSGAASSAKPTTPATPATAAAGRTPTTATTAPAATPAALNENMPLFGAVRVMPIERINSILIVTPRAAYLEEARRWIERFDRPNDNSGEPQLHIYRVQNGNARHLATVLQGIFGGGSQPTTPTTTGVAPGLQRTTANTNLMGNNNGGLGLRAGGLQAGASAQNQQQLQQTSVSAQIGNIRVMSDDLNNSVLVWGTHTEYRKIETTLKRLDIPPTQVLIEASIIEVTLNDALRYGLQWQFSDSRTTTDYTGLGALTNGSSSTSLFTNPTSGFSYTLKNSVGSVRAILSALSSKTSIKVVASPSVMVLDNHQASIVVGSQVPVQSATTTYDNSANNRNTNTYEWKDTGVNLVVTPSVNAGNIVNLQLEQMMTEVGPPEEVTKQRTFYQRQLSSKVAVRSGETIVMGGLIQERGNNSDAGIPGLHTLPVVGALFGTTDNNTQRTELLVILTPRVVRSDVDVREVTEDLRERMKGFSTIESLQKPPAEKQPPALPVSSTQAPQ